MFQAFQGFLFPFILSTFAGITCTPFSKEDPKTLLHLWDSQSSKYQILILADATTLNGTQPYICFETEIYKLLLGLGQVMY